MQIPSKFQVIFVQLYIIPMLLLGIQPTWTHGAPNDGAPGEGTPSKATATRPVLAFYYPWYRRNEWCLCHMPDLPSASYNSGDTATIDRQLHEAAISSNPEWITITSYNEWYEGSMIEPSRTYGNLYLAITRRYTHRT